MGPLLAWGWLNGWFADLVSIAGPRQTPQGRASRRGSLFPLPVLWPPGFADGSWKNFHSCDLYFSSKCWVALACLAINRLYGMADTASPRKAGKVHVAALVSLEEKVKRFLVKDCSLKTSFEEVVGDLKEKRISYTGEEISQPLPLSCEQIALGFPPPGHGGSIPILPLLSGRTKFLMENPLENLIPENERGSGPCQAKVHLVPGEEP